jgi:hypothetical protein
MYYMKKKKLNWDGEGEGRGRRGEGRRGEGGLEVIWRIFRHLPQNSLGI